MEHVIEFMIILYICSYSMQHFGDIKYFLLQFIHMPFKITIIYLFCKPFHTITFVVSISLEKVQNLKGIFVLNVFFNHSGNLI